MSSAPVSDAQLRALSGIPRGSKARPYCLHPYGGADKAIEPGGLCAVYARGRYRVAEVLAVIDTEALVEIELEPSGCHELRIMSTTGKKLPGVAAGYKPVRYDRVPSRWLEYMVEHDIEWNGLRRGGGNTERPIEILSKRPRAKITGFGILATAGMAAGAMLSSPSPAV